jgi:hypothetical protein
LVTTDDGEVTVLWENTRSEGIIERAAALDIGQTELMCRAQVSRESKPVRRCQEAPTYSVMTRSVRARPPTLPGGDPAGWSGRPRLGDDPPQQRAAPNPPPVARDVTRYRCELGIFVLAGRALVPWWSSGADDRSPPR